MSTMHDVALLELAEPVTDVAPMPIDRSSASRPGMLAKIYGAGATGTDPTGAPDSETHRTQLRRAENRLIETDDQWLRYAFDCSTDAPARGGPGEFLCGMDRSNHGRALKGTSRILRRYA